MKNKLLLTIALIFMVLLTGCTKIQPVLLLRPTDFLLWPIIYLLFVWAFSFILSFENGTKNFWFYFFVNLILTPIAGFCMLLYRFKNN